MLTLTRTYTVEVEHIDIVQLSWLLTQHNTEKLKCVIHFCQLLYPVHTKFNISILGNQTFLMFCFIS